METPTKPAEESAEDLRELAAMDEDALRTLALELIHENRRVRTILNTIAKAGLGTGAVVELHETHAFGERTRGFVVCRADRDERAFLDDVRGAIDAHLGPVLRTAESRFTGTSAIQAQRDAAQRPPNFDEEHAVLTAFGDLPGYVREELFEPGADCIVFGLGKNIAAVWPWATARDADDYYLSLRWTRDKVVEGLAAAQRHGDAARVHTGPRTPQPNGAKLLVCVLAESVSVLWWDGGKVVSQ